jgi:nucleoside 2-deoxyribosyltransferase
MASPKARPTIKPHLFLSGPMNSMADINGQMAIRAALAPKFDVYLAPIDGVEIRTLIEMIADPALLSDLFLRAALLVQQIGWAHEVYQLLSADALVLNMDGRVPDEGAIVEATTAYMAGKPVVIYKDSAVTFWDFFDNPMVAALDSTWQVIRDLKKLPAAVAAALAKPPATKTYQYSAPPNIAAARDFGAWVHANHAPLMLALTKSAKQLPAALKGLEPDMTTMQTFAEALIAGTKSISLKAAQTTHAKSVAAASKRAATAAFA